MVKLVVKSIRGEYVVHVSIDGKRIVEADYFTGTAGTDGREEALATANEMATQYRLKGQAVEAYCQGVGRVF